MELNELQGVREGLMLLAVLLSHDKTVHIQSADSSHHESYIHLFALAIHGRTRNHRLCYAVNAVCLPLLCLGSQLLVIPKIFHFGTILLFKRIVIIYEQKRNSIALAFYGNLSYFLFIYAFSTPDLSHV
jgi:hypothetical protein